jgi:biotin carboxylase
MIAIYYEHPDWFKPLFAELDRRGLPYARLHVQDHTFDPSQRHSPYRLLVNRVSAYPSTAAPPEIIFHVSDYLAYLDRIGARVINGSAAFLIGISKAKQLSLLARLGLRHPRAVVICRQQQALDAARQLTFPVVLKPNVGGSGVGIHRFESLPELEAALHTEVLDLGFTHTALLQEFLPAQDRQIVRVEILNGEFLYGLRLPITADSFNYCPADGCNISGDPRLQIVGYTPPAQIIAAAQQIMAAAHIDVGGVEYLVDARDGQPYFYDINPLSNFVANAPQVIGFDPIVNFVDFIQSRAA